MRPGEDRLRAGGNWLTAERFMELVTGVRRTYFRLQVHPTYGVPWEQPAFQEFLRSGTRDIDPESAPLQRMRAHRAAGRISQRVYLIRPPLNDYQRFVFVNYHEMVIAGEDLRIIDTSRTSNPGLPDYDFILLDDEVVIKMHYEEGDGTYLGRELLPDADPTEYQGYRELALDNAIPFLEYERTLQT